MKLEEIAELIDGKIEGNREVEITNVGKIESARNNEITFISNPLYEKFFRNTKAGAVIISEEFKIPNKRNDISIIRVADPYTSFLKLLEVFDKDDDNQLSGISENSFIADGVGIGTNVYIGNFVSIGKNCVIGDNTRIYSNCSVENNVKIGSDCIIYPNVSVYKDCTIQNRVIIHSGAVIGADGFGFAKQDDSTYKKIIQSGIVLIEDDVEIGSNTSIDRATIGETRICKGVKIDDQVMIAHNVVIGENTVIAAQAGIAGSTKIGKRCIIAGQAGIVGHLTICDDVVIGASVGVTKSIDKPGLYSGYRARPHKDTMRMEVGILNLHKLEERLMDLEKKLSK